MAQLNLSYTIWHSQRTGSTWLCDGLEATGVCGRPQEWFNAVDPQHLLRHYGASTASELIAIIQRNGSTANRVFGIKQGYPPKFDQLLSLLQDGVAVRLREIPQP